MAQRKRGSLIDVVTLTEIPFWYEPTVRGRERTMFATPNIIGNRLPMVQWVGGGENEIRLDVFLLDQNSIQSQLDALSQLLAPQSDIGAPHPVYIIIGGMYAGRWFILFDMDTDPETFSYSDLMAPVEAKVRLKLGEIPVNLAYTGTGA